MGKYSMSEDSEGFMGEGASSVCRRGTIIDTGEAVAIKTYKLNELWSHQDVTTTQFKRQIEVLAQLAKPFEEPADSNLWCPHLKHITPSSVFMTLVDFSCDADGQPGFDPHDELLYVVTNLADYSLKDYLQVRRDQKHPLSGASLRNMAEAILLVMAALHSKGLVHIDFKPENIMMFNGKLKLIDVDGCVQAGREVSINDSSISFSIPYVSPELARFLVRGNKKVICVKPELDVWSVGMTLCELVALKPVMATTFTSFLGGGTRSHHEACFLFLDWLSTRRAAPLPSTVKDCDHDLADLVSEWLCVPDVDSRKTCAQALSHPWFLEQAVSCSVPMSRLDLPPAGLPRRVKPRAKTADVSSAEPLYHGKLWKLNSSAKPSDAEKWLQRDMWITQEGSLCYFSQKEDRRLVLLDACALHGSELTRCEGARPFAFSLEFSQEENGCEHDVLYFAADDEAQLLEWRKWLRQVADYDHDQTFRLGQDMEEHIESFRLHLINRRLEIKVDEGDDHGFDASMTAQLWKLKVEGDCTTEADWFERKFFMSNNGSLIYYSEKAEKELIYYTRSDVASATLAKLGFDDIYKPFGFSVKLPPREGVEFDPGMFAAESEDMQEKWLAQFRIHGATISADKSAATMRRKSIR